MSKALLIEHYNGNPNAKLIDSNTTRPGTLGRFKVICCDYLNETANGRLYSKGLWEKAKEKRINDRISKKLAFGELDHPADRLEPLGKYAAVNLVEFTDSPEEGKYYGVFDILDTEDGKKIKTYLDYGSQIGVSSRGAGDIVRLEGRQCIDEDSYDWEAFDVVLDPAVSCSKAYYVESVGRNLDDKFESDIKEATTHKDLDTLKSLVEYANVSNKDSLLEMINTKKESIKSEEDTILSGVIEDLEKSTSRVNELEEERTSLLKEKSASATRVSELEDLNKKLVNANKSLNNSKAKLESNNAHLNGRIKDLYSKISKCESTIKDLTLRCNSLTESLKKQESKLKVNNSKVVESNTRLKKRLSDLKENTIETNNKLESVINENKLLIEENNKYKSSEKVLTESNKLLLNKYLVSEARSNGISETELRNKLKGSNLTVESIDQAVVELCESKEVLRAMPFRITEGELVESTSSTLDPALERAVRMHKAVSNH